MEPTRNESILSLHPKVRTAMAGALLTCEKSGLNCFLFEGLRADQRQAWLYAQGRTTPGPVVTHANVGTSWHRYGCAGDIVFKDQHNRWTWEGDYAAVGKIFTDAGFFWGKHFKSFSEMDHFEMTFGLALPDAEALFAKGGNAKVWSKIDQLVGKPS